MDQPRPIIQLKKKRIDHWLEWMSWLLTAFIWFYSCFHYPSLPEIIPVHYGEGGMADGYGSKNTLFLVPSIVTAMVILLKVINRYPHRFNYLANINQDNAAYQYNMATRLIRYLQFFIPTMFLYIVVIEIKGASEQNSTLGPWFLLLLITGIMVPTVYTVYQSLIKK